MAWDNFTLFSFSSALFAIFLTRTILKRYFGTREGKILFYGSVCIPDKDKTRCGDVPTLLTIRPMDQSTAITQVFNIFIRYIYNWV